MSYPPSESTNEVFLLLSATKVMFFTPVCHSVHGGGSASVHPGIPHPLPLGADPPQSRQPLGADTIWTRHTPLEQTPPGSRSPWTRHPPSRHPPGPGTSPGADGADTPQTRHPPRPGTPQTRHPAADAYWNAFLFCIRFV